MERARADDYFDYLLLLYTSDVILKHVSSERFLFVRLIPNPLAIRAEGETEITGAGTMSIRVRG